jgi:hypothetical protein
VKANPFFPKGSVAQDPSPPLIEVQSPTPEQRLNPTNDIWLKFKVTVPKTSWGSIGTTFGSITSVSYILDSRQEHNLAQDIMVRQHMIFMQVQNQVSKKLCKQNRLTTQFNIIFG